MHAAGLRPSSGITVMAMPGVNKQNLLAVALVINRSRDGPAFVFHYPPNVQPVNSISPTPAEAAEAADDASLHASRNLSSDVLRHHDDDLMAESGASTVLWERLAGFPTRDLAGILTPARSYHKKLFQLSLDPLVCISYPVHVPENGRWKRARKLDKSRAPSASKPPDEAAETEQQPEVVKDSTKDDADDEKRSSMTMFNLVFILLPKKNELKELVDALYGNVVKKINKAYRYSQQHSDFVWKESKRILAAKDKAREDGVTNVGALWKEILHMSSLAASLHDMYEAVSQNKMATLHLDTAAGVLSPSVQIPAPCYVSDIPADHDRGRRGLWLTTANAFLSQDALDEPGFLDRNFALLLMEDEKKIIAELQADRDPTTLSMVEFVRLAKPTMSFYQVGQSDVLTLGQVRKYAQHFIFWRRAIAIPPLHARDTYMVSPNCHLGRLPQASHEWQRAFPVAPPLPNFLAELSMCPRAFKTFCPTKAHRPLYLRMLAWLMRGGWVTQLCTFAYVVVWPEIIYEVDYEMEAEELAAAAEEARAQQEAVAEAAATVAAAEAAAESRDDDDDDDDDDNNDDDDNDVIVVLNDNKDYDDDPPSAHPHQDSASAAAAEKARLERMSARAHRAAADKATTHTRKTVPVATAHPSTNEGPHLTGLTPHLILDAKKATGKESRYLSAIAHRFRDDKLRSAWPLMCKYFDGRCALERIALQVDMRRNEAWALLTAMNEYLLCTRHW
ncbi:hypothetical protein L249_7322 [Ophiocordyceps polyrhachis-furcata BCC 54312]|uniref:Nitrogen permease regulator 3 n=1 Tax=Ophiocordyceps polyrhachis-furcata BCC 54312 TaxID=1330021 RepID=A0A367L9J4_9HYPO|nr:hypothetical protein L249_7322 [Ophiocordyceps polyrhachis-furcata BCC 54312]